MQTDYVTILKSKLDERSRRNPKYSLRAFARDLDLHPSYINNIFKRRRQLSLEKAMMVSTQLFPKMHEKDYFIRLVQLATAKTERARLLARQNLATVKIFDQISDLQVEQFATISDWYHFAILEMTFIENEHLTPASVSQRIGINEKEAANAIDQLINLGLLRFQNGNWKKKEKHLAVNLNHDIANELVKKGHRQYLTKAGQSLNVDPLDEREFQNITMAVDPSKLIEAKDRIKKFIWELCEFLESGPRKKLYQVSVQLFPLEKKARK